MSRQLIGIYKWQYNGVAPWDEIIHWCQDHLWYCWNDGFDTIHFDDGGEYTAFLLRWQ